MTSLYEDNISLAEKIAMLPPELRDQALDGLSPDDLLHDWSFRQIIMEKKITNPASWRLGYLANARWAWRGENSYSK